MDYWTGCLDLIPGPLVRRRAGCVPISELYRMFISFTLASRIVAFKIVIRFQLMMACRQYGFLTVFLFLELGIPTSFSYLKSQINSGKPVIIQ